MPNKRKTDKEQDLLKLVKTKGDDSDLFLLDKLHEIEDVIEDTRHIIEELQKEKPENKQVEDLAMKLAINLARFEKGEDGKDGVDGEDGLDGKDGRDGKNGRDGKDGKDGIGLDGKNGKDGRDGKDGKDGSPDTPLGIRNKLESLIDDARLDVKAIKGIEGLIKDIKTLKEKPVVMGITGRDLIKDIDLSAQLDGVTKTFNIPAIYNIISVVSSSFPTAFRKTIDYTYTGTTITFTSEINASSTLASGQTLIITAIVA